MVVDMKGFGIGFDWAGVTEDSRQRKGKGWGRKRVFTHTCALKNNLQFKGLYFLDIVSVTNQLNM